MRGVMRATLLFAASVFAISANAGSDCSAEHTAEVKTADETHSQPSGVEEHELILRQAIRERENDLLERQKQQLEKLQQQAERDAARAEKLQQITNRS
ncbi:hypothetical protein ACJJIW_06010 [Microbulbifer sp. JMSA004]|uniref:hypothetical protein n=1 Tax=unclassified Microbulbifer TaxID=2619833 RepID=UPI0024AD3DCC|nr:hypothetical protein [Microbulbifer sp. VAAF005]WHI44787.1 hypothetical protein P0078_13640 [Microbulbifer sp. VAAF005]